MAALTGAEGPCGAPTGSHVQPSEVVARKADTKREARLHELQAQVGKVESLDHLKEQLGKLFAEEHVDIDLVRALMTSYKSNMADWIKYAAWDPHRYTRNLVDEGNGKYNVMILCWNEGQGSAIHDHAGAHCFLKSIKGTFLETQFYWPDDGPGKDDAKDDTKDNDKDAMKYRSEHDPAEEDFHPLKEKTKIVIHENEVGYIHDSIGLHRVENYSHVDKAASLHLYCPPYSSCDAFDERTGRRRECEVTFYTKFGQKTNEPKQQCAENN